MSDPARDPDLFNEDLAPVPPEKRTWGVGHIAALWIGMAICVPTYTLASERVAGGMSAWQAVFVIALANLIVLGPLLANGHPGTRYGIPFPVVVRASFGVRGAQVPAILRALVACGWFGIQCWFGGLGLWVTAGALFPSVSAPDVMILGADLAKLCWFFVFWAINVFFIWRGMESIKWLETLAAPFLLLCGAALLVWAIASGGGLGNVMAEPARKPLADTFAIGLTSGVSFWATLALNIPDFSRYARSQRDQMIGQAIAMPTTMTLFAFIGVATTAATVIVFGRALVYPDELVTKFGNPLIVGVSMLGLAIATLSTNIAANVVSPANDFANLAPSKISYRGGGMITAVIGVLICPWLILKSAGNYIYVWLIGYGVLLGPIGAIMIVDYFVLRRRELAVEDLYRRGGRYEYTNGVNWRAMLAFALGVAPCLPGFIVAASGTAPSSVPAIFNHLYTWAWFVSSAVGGVAYYLLMRRRVLVTLLAAAAFVLPACGGDDDGDGGTVTDAPAGGDAAAADGPQPIDGPALDAPTDAPAAFTLTSTAITEGGVIPDMYSCQGVNVSPPLAWSGGAAAPGYAIIFTDNNNGLVHSIIWDIPGDVMALPENVAKLAEPPVPAGAKQTLAYDNQTRGYLGPCPGSMHTYEFALYALDERPLTGVSLNSTRTQVRNAILAHDTAVTRLTATFTP